MQGWAAVKKELVSIASMFDLDIDETRIKWYMGLLAGRDPGEVFTALRNWAMTTTTRRLPLPGELLSTPGEIVAGKILHAIRKYGRENGAEAKAALGPAWRVVEMMSGWGSLCETLQIKDERMFFAQARDLWNKLELKGEVNGAHTWTIGGQDRPKDLGAGAQSRLDNESRGVSRALESCRIKRIEDPTLKKP